MSVETMALIVMSNLPAWASSNHTDTCTVRRFVSMPISLSISWTAGAQVLKDGASRTRKSTPLMPLA